MSRRIQVGRGVSKIQLQLSAHGMQNLDRSHLPYRTCTRLSRKCAAGSSTLSPKARDQSREIYHAPGPLLTGLRSECLRWIEKAAAPEGLVRECAGLPLLESRKSRRRHPAI